MAASTEELRRELLRLTRVIAQIESRPRRELARWASTLRDLHAKRRMVDRVLRHRRFEAAKKIVDFRRWCDGPRAA